MREWTGQNTQAFAVMSREAARAFDANAIETLGIPGAVLMENAGRGAAGVILGPVGLAPEGRAVIFCGVGNNGGDGFVIARHLFNHGVRVQAVLCGDPTRLRGDALLNYEICLRMGISIVQLKVDKKGLPSAIRTLCRRSDVIVDALFGTGLKGELDEWFVILISCLNAQHTPIVAVDIPSGLDCDTGLPLPVSIEAAATVTFAGLKQGFVRTPESRRATGRVFVASIGVEPPVQA
jgi:NAD(P)H-hydrate epimerase